MIKLYTGSSCPACTALKKRLAKLNLEGYEECNISNSEHKDALVSLGLRSIPVLALYNDKGVMRNTLVGNIASDIHLEVFFGLLET